MNTAITSDRILVNFVVNGKPAHLESEPFASLARVLRNDLQLTGTKLGCEAGDCGACTVLIDGEQACACLVPIAQIDGAEITTVEGYDKHPKLHALRRAFQRLGAAQCGFCTPGMLMSACDLLAGNSRPDRREVEDALGGVLCRCTGYIKIVDAVIAAARALNTPADVLPEPDFPTAVGARVPRVEGMAKVSGTEVFAADDAPADALWLRVVRSPHARARFELGDLGPLRARHPGLAAVLTAKDVPGSNRFGIYPNLKDQPVLSEGSVRYRGEAVVALVGDQDTLQTMGDEELPIRWTVQEPVADVQAAQAADAPILHEGCENNLLTRGLLCKGDLESARARAGAEAQGEWETSFVEHAYLEPEAGYARYIDEQHIAVHACTQAPYMDRGEVAHVTGLDAENVRIVPSGCGGGFGGKLDVSVQPLLAVAAWALKRNVRVTYSRPESMASSTKRHATRIRAKAFAASDGKLLGLDLYGEFDTGAYASWGPTVAGRVPVHATGPYFVPNVRCETPAYYTNHPPAGAFRGFGTPQAALVRELLYDQLADQLNIDRWRFRHINAIRAGDATASGQVLKASVGMVECLEALQSDWRSLKDDAEVFNDRNTHIRRGVGIGCMWYGCGNTSLSNPSTMRVTLARNGRLTFYNGAAEIGQGSNTVLLQICADAVGLPITAFDLVLGDTKLTEDGGKTSASRQTFVSGKAAYLAGTALRERLLALCESESLSAKLVLTGHRLRVTDLQGSREVDLADLPGTAEIVAEGKGTFDPPTTTLDANGQGSPYATYAFAAQVCNVDVDTRLGTVKVRRLAAAHDVGKAINPTLVEGQIHGGIVQGLGMALMEEYLQGRTENLHDYLIPTFGDVPEITVKLIEDPEPLGPYGAKGVGEPALVPTPAAILSAIRHATGVTMRKIPVLPYRMLRELKLKGKG